jgi:hypothetical protein
VVGEDGGLGLGRRVRVVGRVGGEGRRSSHREGCGGRRRSDGRRGANSTDGGGGGTGAGDGEGNRLRSSLLLLLLLLLHLLGNKVRWESLLLGVVGVLRRSAVSLRQCISTDSETEDGIGTHRLLSLPLRRVTHHATLRQPSVGRSRARGAKLPSVGSLRLPLLHHRTAKLPVPLLLSGSSARAVDSSRSAIRLLLLERGTVGDVLGRS